MIESFYMTDKINPNLIKEFKICFYDSHLLNKAVSETRLQTSIFKIVRDYNFLYSIHTASLSLYKHIQSIDIN